MADDKDSVDLEEHLAFVLEKSHFATPVQFVKEILRVPPITELPLSPENILGVANIRGEVLPVYDVKKRIGLGQAQPLSKSARLLIMSTPEGRAAILVDAVTGVIRCRPPQSGPPTPSDPLSPVSSCVRVRDQTYALLNLEQAIS